MCPGLPVTPPPLAVEPLLVGCPVSDACAPIPMAHREQMLTSNLHRHHMVDARINWSATAARYPKGWPRGVPFATWG